MGEASLSGVLLWPAPKLPVNLYGLREGGWYGGKETIEGGIWYRLHRFCIILFSYWAPSSALPYKEYKTTPHGGPHPSHQLPIITGISIFDIIIHSVSPAKELSHPNEKKGLGCPRDSSGLSPRESNGLSPPSESNEIFRFYNSTQILTIEVLMRILII